MEHRYCTSWQERRRCSGREPTAASERVLYREAWRSCPPSSVCKTRPSHFLLRQLLPPLPRGTRVLLVTHTTTPTPLDYHGVPGNRCTGYPDTHDETRASAPLSKAFGRPDPRTEGTRGQEREVHELCRNPSLTPGWNCTSSHGWSHLLHHALLLQEMPPGCICARWWSQNKKYLFGGRKEEEDANIGVGCAISVDNVHAYTHSFTNPCIFTRHMRRQNETAQTPLACILIYICTHLLRSCILFLVGKLLNRENFATRWRLHETIRIYIWPRDPVLARHTSLVALSAVYPLFSPAALPSHHSCGYVADIPASGQDRSLHSRLLLTLHHLSVPAKQKCRVTEQPAPWWCLEGYCPTSSKLL